MNCTKCGIELKKAICNECETNHKNLLYRMADEAQVRRDYVDAMEYYELIKGSVDSEEELSDIHRAMAKLGFSVTDLTGKSIRNDKIKFNLLVGLKGFFIITAFISAMMIIFSIYKLYL